MRGYPRRAGSVSLEAAEAEETAAPVAKRVTVDVPPEVPDAATGAGMERFLLRGGLVDAWFEDAAGCDVLAVTFDNLSSIGEYDPPQPWLRWRMRQAGIPLLGIMASRKDWYRNEDTAPLITALREAGLFARFRRVVFVGASMGGFAALAFAPLVPSAAVQASVAPLERFMGMQMSAESVGRAQLILGLLATVGALLLATVALLSWRFIWLPRQAKAANGGAQE